MTTQISIRFEDETMKRIDSFVDGVRFRSRAQLVAVAVDEWMQKIAAEDGLKNSFFRAWLIRCGDCASYSCGSNACLRGHAGPSDDGSCIDFSEAP